MASRSPNADRLIREMARRGNGFNVRSYLEHQRARSKFTLMEIHTMLDIIEALWDKIETPKKPKGNAPV